MKSAVLLTLICDNCGRAFTRLAYDDRANRKAGHRHTFCSHQCAGEWKKGEPLVTLTCEQCGRTFTRLARLQRGDIKKGYKHTYCSYACSGSAVTGRQLITLTCDTCGRQFERDLSMYKARCKAGYRHTYCSYACAGAGKRPPGSHREPELLELTCDKCGTLFQRRATRQRDRWGRGYQHVYCSPSCAGTASHLHGGARLAVLAIRRSDPGRKAISIARELGISRERVRQILKEVGLPTNVGGFKYKPTRAYKEQARILSPDMIRLAKDIIHSHQEKVTC